MVEISRVFSPCLFSPHERVLRPTALFIVLRGVAVQKGVPFCCIRHSGGYPPFTAPTPKNADTQEAYASTGCTQYYAPNEGM